MDGLVCMSGLGVCTIDGWMGEGRASDLVLVQCMVHGEACVCMCVCMYVEGVLHSSYCTISHTTSHTCLPAPTDGRTGRFARVRFAK
jgi:hypothetical protein